MMKEQICTPKQLLTAAGVSRNINSFVVVNYLLRVPSSPRNIWIQYQSLVFSLFDCPEYVSERNIVVADM